MNYSQLIADSWELAENHRYLQWYAVFPMMTGIIMGLIYYPLRFGVYFRESFYDDTFVFFQNLSKNDPGLFSLLIVVLVLAGLFYWLFSSFFEGALIGMVNRIEEANGAPIKKGIGVAFGLKSYLQLVELHSLTSIMNPAYIFVIMSLLHQFLPKAFDALFWFGFFLFVVGIIVKLGVSYADYHLVINNDGVISSFKASFSLFIFNLKETVFLFFVFALIAARAVINLLLVILIPMLLMWASSFLLELLPSIFVNALIIVMCLFFYGLVVKFASFLSVFSTALWVKSYKILIKETEDSLAILE